MKVLVLEGEGYSFDDDLIGNIYEVDAIVGDDIWFIVDHEHDVRRGTPYASGEIWRFKSHRLAIVPETEIAPTKKAKKEKKAKQKPPRREQTIVYFLFVDGKDYQQRRVKGVVVNAEHKAVHVNTDRDLGDGLVVRENSTVPFALIEAMRVSTPEGEYCYYFHKGEIVSTARDFTKNAPFRTTTH